MSSFKAFRIHRDETRFEASMTSLSLDQLTEGDVVVEVLYSSINYKDALAATGKGRILRRPTLNGGIDMAGRVLHSEAPQFAPGDEVFVCGAALSETLDGGYAERARLPAELLMRPPAGLSLRDTMAIGTAGITAAIAVQRLQDNGQPRDKGALLVTGATGGVGSFAIHLLSELGFEVVASSGKHSAHEYLRQLGAHDVIGRFEGAADSIKPLDKGQWGGAIDSIGGDTLAWLASTTRPWGSIACIGLAGGTQLNTTVMPLILRGVSLLGINCLEVPQPVLASCWKRLGHEWKPRLLDTIAPHEIAFADLPGAFDAYIKGEVVGRTVVRMPAADNVR